MADPTRLHTPQPPLRSRWLALRGVVVSVVIAGLLLAGAAIGWWYVRRSLNEKAALHFQNAVQGIVDALTTRLESQVAALNGGRGLYAASKMVDRDEFSAFLRAQGAFATLPGLVGIGFVERVPQADKAAFLERVRADTTLRPGGYPTFTIQPEGEREEYFVVTYLEPHERNESVFGFDLGTDPLRRHILERARDTGQVVMSPRMILLTGSGHDVGFLVAVPIYRNHLPHETVEERRAALHGFILGGLDAETFFASVLHPTVVGEGQVDLEIFDTNIVTFESFHGRVSSLEEHRLYASNPHRVELAAEHASPFHRLLAMEVYGEMWTLHFMTAPGFGLDPTQRHLPAWILLSGVLMSGLVFGLFYALTTSRARAVRLTERMTSELRAQQEHLLTRDRAMAATTNGVVITDPHQPDNPVIYCNPGFEQLTGYAEEETLGRNLRFLARDDHDQPGLAEVRKALCERRGCQVVIRNYKKDGTMFWNTLSISPIFDEQGDLLNYVGVQHDTTEHKRLEDELNRKAEESLASNTELTRREKVTQSLLEDLQTSKNSLEQQQRSLQEAHASLRRSHEELQAVQLQLIQAAKMESVGRMAAGVAHEVKNPLAIILMGIAYLSKQLPNGDPTLGMVLNDMEGAVRRADTVIRGLLDFSAPGELHLSAEDLNAVIEQSLLLVKHDLDKAHVTAVRELAPSLPPLKLDGSKIQQALINLFTNAVHAMPNGGTLTVRTGIKPVAEVGRALASRNPGRAFTGATVIVAEVEDTGTGIPEDKLPKIFDPFFTTKATGKGTGLGLTVTNKIVELHGGVLDIRNRAEGGVRATLVFA